MSCNLICVRRESDFVLGDADCCRVDEVTKTKQAVADGKVSATRSQITAWQTIKMAGTCYTP